MENDNKATDETQDLFDNRQATKFLGVSVRAMRHRHKSDKLVPDAKGADGRGKKSKYSLDQLKKDDKFPPKDNIRECW